MKIIVVAATAFALAGTPVEAGQTAQAPDPVEVAHYVLHRVCLRILDGPAATPELVTRVAAEARLVERNGLWLARTGTNSGLALSWNSESGTCQISAAGTGPVGAAFLARAEHDGWRSLQHEDSAPEGGVMDLLCARPEGFEDDICMTVLQQVPAQPNGTFMTVTVLKAP